MFFSQFALLCFAEERYDRSIRNSPLPESISDSGEKLTRQVFGLESEACEHLFEKSTKQATGFLFQRISHATLAHFRKEFTHIQTFA